MRTALAALFVLAAASVSFAAGPSAKPGASPAATPAPEKAPEPGKDECSAADAKTGAVIASATGDYQACLRTVKAEVVKKCDGSAKQIPFVFHRGGQKSITMTAVCN